MKLILSQYDADLITQALISFRNKLVNDIKAYNEKVPEPNRVNVYLEFKRNRINDVTVMLERINERSSIC